MLLVALGLALLRCWGLSTWSLWLDEVFTLTDAGQGGSGNNPLGYALFDWWYGLHPGRPGEAWMRAPAAFFGILSVALVGFGFRAWFGAGPSALAGLFLALSPWHLYWSQNARFYTLAQLLALLGGLAFVAGVAGHRLGRVVVGLALFGAGAMTHPSVAFLGAGFALAPFLSRWLPGGLRPSGRTLGLLFALGLVVLAVGLRWARSVWELWELNKGAANPVHFVASTGYLLTPLLGLAWLCGTWRALRKGSKEAGLVAIATILGLALALGASLVSRMSAQYVFTFLPWLVAGAGYAFLGASRRALVAALLVALPLALESALVLGPRRGDRPRWKEAYAYVFGARGPFDYVLGMEALVGEYYLDPHRVDLRSWTGVTYLDRYRPTAHRAWMRHERPMWLVVNDEQFADWDQADARAMRAFLAEECERMREYPVPWTPRNLDVAVYRWPKAAQPEAR